MSDPRSRSQQPPSPTSGSDGSDPDSNIELPAELIRQVKELMDQWGIEADRVTMKGRLIEENNVEGIFDPFAQGEFYGESTKDTDPAGALDYFIGYVDRVLGRHANDVEIAEFLSGWYNNGIRVIMEDMQKIALNLQNTAQVHAMLVDLTEVGAKWEAVANNKVGNDGS